MASVTHRDSACVCAELTGGGVVKSKLGKTLSHRHTVSLLYSRGPGPGVSTANTHVVFLFCPVLEYLTLPGQATSLTALELNIHSANHEYTGGCVCLVSESNKF